MIMPPYLFNAGFTLMWDWSGANGFDVDTGSTQNMHSQHENFQFRLGRTLQTFIAATYTHRVWCTCTYILLVEVATYDDLPHLLRPLSQCYCPLQ